MDATLRSGNAVKGIGDGSNRKQGAGNVVAGGSGDGLEAESGTSYCGTGTLDLV